jgi:hypothetical protein
MWLSHGASLQVHLLKDFAYSVMPPALQCALLRLGGSLIHASALELDGKAVLLPAWGGVGKSTIATRCLLHGRARFLADDHAIIDQQGLAHLHPLPIHVYTYHMRQDAVLRERVLASLPPGNRCQWRLAAVVKPKRAVRWVPPEKLFGADRLAPKAELGEVIVMFRGDRSEFLWEKITPAQAAVPCAAIMVREIAPFLPLLALAGAGWEDPMFPTIDQAYRLVRETYTRAFAHATCARLLVPRGADGDALMNFLRRMSPMLDAACR